MFTGVTVATANVVTVSVFVVLPFMIDTVAGTVAAPGVLLARLTMTPPAGAGAASVTVPIAFVPGTHLTGWPLARVHLGRNGTTRDLRPAIPGRDGERGDLDRRRIRAVVAPGRPGTVLSRAGWWLDGSRVDRLGCRHGRPAEPVAPNTHPRRSASQQHQLRGNRRRTPIPGHDGRRRSPAGRGHGDSELGAGGSAITARRLAFASRPLKKLTSTWATRCGERIT
jgi:hypothetical protein